MSIEIANRQHAMRVPRKRTVTIVEAVLAQEGIGEAGVSIAFVDNEEIRRINAEFLKRRGVTDVIAFPLSDDLDVGEPCLLGEIVVSAERAQKMADARGGSAQSELLLYVVHGLLHLLGLDDSSPEEAERMHAAALDILNRHSVRGVT